MFCYINVWQCDHTKLRLFPLPEQSPCLHILFPVYTLSLLHTLTNSIYTFKYWYEMSIKPNTNTKLSSHSFTDPERLTMVGRHLKRKGQTIQYVQCQCFTVKLLIYYKAYWDQLCIGTINLSTRQVNYITQCLDISKSATPFIIQTFWNVYGHILETVRMWSNHS